MKSHLLLASLCAISSTAFVFCMDVVEAPKEAKRKHELRTDIAPAKKAPRKRESYLMFEVGKSLHIREYGCRNMAFKTHPDEFVGKKITEVVPLDETDKKALELGFRQSRKENQPKTVPHTVLDTQYSAAIRYLADRQRYSVRVTKVKAPKVDVKAEAIMCDVDLSGQ